MSASLLATCHAEMMTLLAGGDDCGWSAFGASVAAGRLTFDSDAAGKCIDWRLTGANAIWADQNCPYTAPWGGGFFGKLTKGLVPNGGDCAGPGDCANG